MNQPPPFPTTPANVPIVGASQNEVSISPADIVLVNRGSPLSDKPFTQVVLRNGMTVQTPTKVWDDFVTATPKNALSHLRKLDGPK
jgi:hypothetical protein